MKIRHLESLVTAMETFLGNCDSDGGNPGWCYEELANDMAVAAARVYDACMAGQKFAKEQTDNG